jgi:hypothetical protein
MAEKLSDKVFASSEDAIAHGGEKVPILGHLIWFSVKESRIEPEELRRLFAQVGIPTEFIPEDISPINAFKRATSELSEEIEVPLDQNRTAVFLVRLTAKSDTEIVKSIIKEVRDQNDKRLSYEEVGRVHFDKDTKDVRYYATQPDSQPVLDQIKQLYETYGRYITGKQIRAIFHDIIESMSPTQVRPSGAVYFIPHQYADMVQKMEVLSKELIPYGITDFSSAFESIPLIDADKTRSLVELRFEEQNTRDVDKTLVELTKLLQGTDATTRTGARYIEMVKKAKENIARYESMLDKEMSISRMKVEVLDQQVQKLLEKIAQKELAPESKPKEKEETRAAPIAVVVPHVDTAPAPASVPVSAVSPANPGVTASTEKAPVVFDAKTVAAMEEEVLRAEAREPDRDPELLSTDQMVLKPKAAVEGESPQTALQVKAPSNADEFARGLATEIVDKPGVPEHTQTVVTEQDIEIKAEAAAQVEHVIEELVEDVSKVPPVEVTTESLLTGFGVPPGED